MKKLLLFFFFQFLFLNSFAQAGFTSEDKEMLKKTYEISVRLEEKYIAQQKQIEDLKLSINQRFDSQDKRFDSQDKRFDSQDKRLDIQDKRLGDMWSLMLVLLASIIGSIAYMYWDRREANRPLKIKLEDQDKEISRIDFNVKQLMNKAAML